VRLPRRQTGTCSRSIALPDEESRCPRQDLALLTQHLVSRSSSRNRARSSELNRSARSPRSASSWRRQLCSVCSAQPSSAASCFGVRAGAPKQPQRLLPELRRIRRSRPSHHTRSSPKHLARKHPVVLPRFRGLVVNQSGSTPTPSHRPFTPGRSTRAVRKSPKPAAASVKTGPSFSFSHSVCSSLPVPD